MQERGLRPGRGGPPQSSFAVKGRDMSIFFRSVRTMGAVVALIGAGIGALIGAGPAQAELSACNQTDQTISVAIGYSDDGTWTSEGWWTMRAGDCKVMVPGDLKNRYYYWRATQDGQPLPAEEYFFCTSAKVFTIAGDTECAERGYDRVAFSQVDTGEVKSYTINVSGNVSDNVSGNASGSPVAEGADAGPVDELQTIKAQLQGEWYAEADPELESVITGDEWYLIYKGDKNDPAQFEIAQTCPESEGDGPVVLFTFDYTKGAPDCWGLIEANSQRLHIYVYSTGEEAVFVRK
jgi:uncharacterized membrane protein